MANEPIVIRRTSTVEEAEVIVAWLDAEGVSATIIDPDNPGAFAFGVTDAEGIAIGVTDEHEADRATLLLAEHDKRGSAPPAHADSVGEIDVQCTECGRLNPHPGDAAGTVQQCTKCGAHLDIPES